MVIWPRGARMACEWLGVETSRLTSHSNQRRPLVTLLSTDAAVNFVSCAPARGALRVQALWAMRRWRWAEAKRALDEADGSQP
jgi:hypothetical protein